MTDLVTERFPAPFSIGIQGEVGSFNEVAILGYLGRTGITDYSIVPLSTTGRVLNAVANGNVSCGQFAVRNTLGGVVSETIEALAKYASGTFTTIDEYSIPIAHALMKRPDVDFYELDTIMTHPQVLAQCRSQLLRKYPGLTTTSGEGVLIDPATVAQRLSQGILPRSVAVMGNSRLAEINDLVIVESDLQDDPDNYTTFRLVSL